jgi:hypothetical protein
MSQTQYLEPDLESLECQDVDMPHIVLTNGPHDDDGNNNDSNDCDNQ